MNFTISFRQGGSDHTPALTAFNATSILEAAIQIALPEAPNPSIFIVTLPGGNVSSPGRLPTPQNVRASSAGPGLGALGNELFVIWTGTNVSQLVNITTYQLQINNTFVVTSQIATNETAISNPAIIGFNGHVYYSWTGTNADRNINITRLQ